MSVVHDTYAPVPSSPVHSAHASTAGALHPEDEIELEPIEGALEAVPEAAPLADFRRGLEKLGQAELAAMDRVLERKLYELDREEIQEFTDGSDDGFLYCRGFIVLLGRAFYDAVNASPELAVLDAECEEVCYLAAHVYEERFGAFPDHQSGISRETGSNKEGWGRSSECAVAPGSPRRRMREQVRPAPVRRRAAICVTVPR